MIDRVFAVFSDGLVLFSFLLVCALSTYAFHRLWILWLYYRHYKFAPPLAVPPVPAEWPRVTVQLPLFNERFVAERLINSVAALDYPADRLQIQVLDDSTDETRDIVHELVLRHRARGVRIDHVRRDNREGFKAGALARGLASAFGEFVAVFDADFLPPVDFLKRTVPHFADSAIGLVQARWGHINESYSLLTRLQSLFLDGHFVLEHTARNRSGAFFNFNGTAGIWRRRAIEESGGWSDDTLTEDLDLSYRAQMKGWRFLYLPDLVCPAELPVDMPGFRNQQHRWTKGAFQVARKVLPGLWKSALPFSVKVEATAHLTANVGYFLMVVYTLFLAPSLWARSISSLPPGLLVGEIALLLASVLLLFFFYLVAHREAGPGRRFAFKEIPVLMALGVGMAWNNARAVFEAMAGIPSDFIRTAKFNITGREIKWRGNQYAAQGGGRGILELCIALYLGAALVWCGCQGLWMAVPVLALFFAGYLSVGGWMLSHASKVHP